MHRRPRTPLPSRWPSWSSACGVRSPYCSLSLPTNHYTKRATTCVYGELGGHKPLNIWVVGSLGHKKFHPPPPSSPRSPRPPSPKEIAWGQRPAALRARRKACLPAAELGVRGRGQLKAQWQRKRPALAPFGTWVDVGHRFEVVQRLKPCF